MRAILCLFFIGLLSAFCFTACPGGGDLREDRAPGGDGGVGGDTPAPDGGPADADPTGDGSAAQRPPLPVVPRPTFDPTAPAPCESHTACYLGAKTALATGQRAGYLRTIDLCEYYRGRFQLEKFYGMCLLMLADAYRHLNNFDEARRCYERFLTSGADDADLALQARSSLDEVEQGARTPHAYSDYLRAVSLLTRLGQEGDPQLLTAAETLLTRLRDELPEWPLADRVSFLLGQIAAMSKEPGSGDDADAAPAAATGGAEAGAAAADGGPVQDEKAPESDPSPVAN